MFLCICRTTSVVLELVFGLLAFPACSPLASAGGCSASKTDFTSVNLVNLVGQSLPRVPQFSCNDTHGCLRINCDKPRGEALSVKHSFATQRRVYNGENIVNKIATYFKVRTKKLKCKNTICTQKRNSSWV